MSTIILTSKLFSVRVCCSSTVPSPPHAPTIIADKHIDNVQGAANKIVLLTGNLFGGAGGGTTVAFDTVWNATPIIKTF